MSVHRYGWKWLPAAALAFAATPALAHPGHGDGFAAGVLHPLTGLDHLAAMLLVGLWAGLAFAKRAWACPATFVAFSLGGFGYGVAGGALPFAELLIAASIAVLAAAIVFRLRPPLGIAAPMVALFAVGHGYAHGAEMPGGDGIGFATGFVTTTILLHGAGLALAYLATRRRGLARSGR